MVLAKGICRFQGRKLGKLPHFVRAANPRPRPIAQPSRRPCGERPRIYAFPCFWGNKSVFCEYYESIALSTLMQKNNGREFIPSAWCWRRESNPRPIDYESIALPTEPRQHIIFNCLNIISNQNTNVKEYRLKFLILFKIFLYYWFYDFFNITLLSFLQFSILSKPINSQNNFGKLSSKTCQKHRKSGKIHQEYLFADSNVFRQFYRCIYDDKTNGGTT